MAYVSRTPLEKVAEAISDLTYRDMCELAHQIADRLNDAGTWSISEASDHQDAETSLADQFSDWAVNRNEDYERRAEASK